MDERLYERANVRLYSVRSIGEVRSRASIRVRRPLAQQLPERTAPELVYLETNSSILRIVLHHSKHDTLSMDDRSTFLCPSCETVVTISKTPDGTWNACCPNIACHAEFSKEQIAQIFAGTPMKPAVEERA